MNWYVVRLVVLIASVLATVVSFAAVMAYLEHGPTRIALRLVPLVAALFAADALLLGSVWR